MATSSPLGPSAAMVPMYSCPGVQFLLKGSPPCTSAGDPEAMTSRSVAQIATASMRTNTSAARGTGPGFSISPSSPGLPSTQARIRSGMGKFLAVLTPAGAYMKGLLLEIASRLGCSGHRPKAHAVGNRQRGVGAVEELNRREQEIRFADVLDAVHHVFAGGVAQVHGIAGIVDGLGDATGLVVAARAPVAVAGPEIVEHVPVEGAALARWHQQMPDAQLVGFGDEHAAHEGVHGVLFQLLAQPLRPAVERIGGSDGDVFTHASPPQLATP